MTLRLCALGLVLGVLLPSVRPPVRLSAQAKPVSITTTEAFDAGSIPAYRGTHADIYAYIDRNQPGHLANLQRWLRQPSVSAQNLGIAEMAEMVRGDLVKLGCREAELVPTAGHPGVFAYCDEGAPRTLLVYMMYDVQPVEPAEWRSPPFAAAVVEHDLGRVLMGRGATNQKGPQRAFLNAAEAVRAVAGKLPVNKLMTGRLRLEQINEGFDLLHEGKAVRQVVTF